MLKLKVDTSVFFAALALAILPSAAQARNCELPHEQVQLKCGGEMPNTFDSEAPINSDQASGIAKARPASELLKEYRARSASFTALVEKADAEYRAYLNAKSR